MVDQVILVGIDEILDTRMGTLLTLKTPNESEQDVFKINKYWERASDNFSYWVDQSEYDKAYQNRDLRILKNSMITSVPYFLNTLTRSLQTHKEDHFEITKIIVRVNLHPYNFSEQEKIDLKECLRSYLAYTCEIDFVKMDYKDISPAYLNNHVDAFIIYDFSQWYKWHSTALTLKPIPLVTVYTPVRLSDSSVVVTQEIKNEANPAYVELSLYEFILLEYKDIDLFSMFT